MTIRTWWPLGRTIGWAALGLAGLALPPDLVRAQEANAGTSESPENGESAPPPAAPAPGETSVVLSGSPEELERILAVLRQFDGIRIEPTRYGPSAHPYRLDEPYDPGSPHQGTLHPHPFSPSQASRFRPDHDGWGYGPSYGRYGYEYGGYYDRGFEAGYRQGHFYGRREMEAELRAPLFISNYLVAMQTGALEFRAGDYGSSARRFVLAARLDNGDAFSRILAGHALVAVGRYHEAAALIARALELQPKLSYVNRDIRDDYGRKDDFVLHREKLAGAAQNAGDQPDLWALLGYYDFFGGQPHSALGSLSKAEALDPDHELAQRLLEVARLSLPPAEGDHAD